MKGLSTKKKASIIIGIVLLVVAAVLVFYTVKNPNDAFPWSKRVSFLLFGALVWLICECLLDIPFLRDRRFQNNNGNLVLTALFYVFAVLFVIMEISGLLKPSIFTMLRGFVIPAGICLGTEQIILRYRSKKGNE